MAHSKSMLFEDRINDLFNNASSSSQIDYGFNHTISQPYFGYDSFTNASDNSIEILKKENAEMKLRFNLLLEFLISKNVIENVDDFSEYINSKLVAMKLASKEFSFEEQEKIDKQIKEYGDIKKNTDIIKK